MIKITVQHRDILTSNINPNKPIKYIRAAWFDFLAIIVSNNFPNQPITLKSY